MGNLTTVDYISDQYFCENENSILYSLEIQASKSPEYEYITTLINNVDNYFTYFKPFVAKQKTGLILGTHWADFNTIKNSEEFQFMLNKMEEIGLKGHNAKNNFMQIKIKNNIDPKVMKKIHLFLIKNKMLCRTIARKSKVFNFNFNEVRHF